MKFSEDKFVDDLALNPIRKYGLERNRDLPAVTYRENSREKFITVTDKHLRGQLSYPDRGVVKVFCQNRYYLIPPAQVIWIPPFARHQVSIENNTPLNYIFLDPSACSLLPETSEIYNLTPLAKELVSRAHTFGANYQPGSGEFKIVEAMIYELSSLSRSKLNLPYGTDERVLRVIEKIKSDIGSNKKIDDYAKIAYSSKRNLNRLFKKDTGLTFGAWRKQFKVMSAIEMLHKGESVSNVAINLGYRSLSSFIETFRLSTGKTPSNYFSA